MPLRSIDRQLIERCRNHEPGSWSAFVDRYLGLIYHVVNHVSYSRSIPLTPADVEDISAQVLLRIADNDYGSLKRFQARSSLPTYLTVVARRLAVKEIVKRHREASLGHSRAHLASLDEEGEVAIEPIGSEAEVERLVAGRPEREANVARLYPLSALGPGQIADRVGMPEHEVRDILETLSGRSNSG